MSPLAAVVVVVVVVVVVAGINKSLGKLNTQMNLLLMMLPRFIK